MSSVNNTYYYNAITNELFQVIQKGVQFKSDNTEQCDNHFSVLQNVENKTLMFVWPDQIENCFVLDQNCSVTKLRYLKQHELCVGMVVSDDTGLGVIAAVHERMRCNTGSVTPIDIIFYNGCRYRFAVL